VLLRFVQVTKLNSNLHYVEIYVNSAYVFSCFLQFIIDLYLLSRKNYFLFKKRQKDKIYQFVNMVLNFRRKTVYGAYWQAFKK